MAGRKIFISYKYGDTNVQALPDFTGPYELTTARHYVDALQALLDYTDHINKGEKDQESLGEFKDSTIATKLKGKIYDSTMTIVLMSPNMKDYACAEDDQWIPWEVAMSLRELTREGRVSGTNAMMAIALPDIYGQYDYAVVDNTCATCHCRTWHTNNFFGIIQRNMFNRKKPNFSGCSAHYPYDPPQIGANHSYIYPVKWGDFVQAVDFHIGIASSIHEEIENFELSKTP
jgi:hypothetical protein